MLPAVGPAHASAPPLSNQLQDHPSAYLSMLGREPLRYGGYLAVLAALAAAGDTTPAGGTTTGEIGQSEAVSSGSGSPMPKP